MHAAGAEILGCPGENGHPIGIDRPETIAACASGTAHGEYVGPQRSQAPHCVGIERAGQCHEPSGIATTIDLRLPGKIDTGSVRLVPCVEQDALALFDRAGCLDNGVGMWCTRGLPIDIDDCHPGSRRGPGLALELANHSPTVNPVGRGVRQAELAEGHSRPGV